MPGGVLHIADTGQAFWCDLARETVCHLDADPSRVRAVTSAEFVRNEPRPAWSVLSTSA